MTRRRSSIPRTAKIFACAAALIAPASQAKAQQLIAWPVGAAATFRNLLPWQPIRPFPHPRPFPLPQPRPLPTPPAQAEPLALTGYQVEGTIEDQAANLNFTVVFHNPGRQRLEGVLVMPIPADTVLSGFSMTVGGKKMNAELLEAEKAGAIYQSIVNQVKDPALLELVGERLLRAKVFPIEPGGEVSVRLSLTQILRKSGDLISLNVPMKSAALLQGQKGRGKALIHLNASKPIRALYSPNAGVVLSRSGERRAEIVFEEKSAGDAADLALFYSLREDPLAAGLLTFREEGEDGFFLLSLSPRPAFEEKDVLPRDMVFIVDRSGSMEEGGKMEQARKAMVYCLSRLSPQDRFGLVDFATDSNLFESRLAAATPENKARALRYVERLEAAGGTNIESALADGLGLLQNAPGRVPMIFFVTDGLPTVGDTDIAALLKKAVDRNSAFRARIFTFGVGADVNTLLLDKLAETNRGWRDYVAPGESIEAKVSALYQKVAKPALSDVRVEWKGVEAEQVYPRPLTDLFYGSQLVLMGRFRGRGKGTLVVTGRSGSRGESFEFPVEWPEAASRHAFLPRLWAHRKVSHEVDAIRLSGRADPEVVKDIVKLAKRYGIVTPYTSFLVTEEGEDPRNAHGAAVRRFEALSADAAVSGFSGGAERSRMAQKASQWLSFGGGSGGGVMASVAPAPALALAEAEARRELKEEGRSAVETRSIAGKTFYLRAGTWVDGDYELSENKSSLRAVKIGYLSPEYFELVRNHPGIARYLSLGRSLTIFYRGAVYEIGE